MSLRRLPERGGHVHHPKANQGVEINGSPSEKVIGMLIVGTAVPFEKRVQFVGFPCEYNGRPIMEKQFGGTKGKAQVFDNGSYL